MQVCAQPRAPRTLPRESTSALRSRWPPTIQTPPASWGRQPNVHAAAGEYVTTYAVPRGHARARGSPRCYFAAESHTDIRAREMGIDPLGFRLLNAERSSEFADQVDEQLRKVVDRAVGCLQLGYAAVIVARASNGSW